jgi:16S rRNA (uracil1498-N3)-methyltransferase
MRISRLYVRCGLRTGDSVLLDPDSAHYLRTVLRLKRGAELVLFNGDGGDYPGRVAEAGRDGVRVVLEARRERITESPLRVHLGLGISRGDRMDLAVQKAVELGVAHLSPLFTQHCVVRLEIERQQTRHEHWRKVVQSACEQCGRSCLPALDPPAGLAAWVSGRSGLRLLLDPEGEFTLADLPAPEAGVTLLSGPEGGFADSERDLARREGFLGVRLGPRILRAETAVLAALAAMQVLWGDWGGA